MDERSLVAEMLIKLPAKLVFVVGLATASSEAGGLLRRLGASLNPDISVFVTALKQEDS